MLIFEMRLWSTNYPHNTDSGAEFYGTKGQMYLSRRGKIEVRGDRMVAGMPVRVPHANLLPGSAGGGQRVASGPADGHQAQAQAALPQRSPETTRSRLSGFQRGGRRAEGQTPHAGERTDR